MYDVIHKHMFLCSLLQVPRINSLMCYILQAEKLGLLKILGFDKTLKFNQVEFEPRTY